METKNNSITGNLARQIGFTLAEVLITLGIIGVVAQMTIPTLMQSVQDQVTVTSLKKAYSTLSQAYTMAVTENGTPDNWDLGGTQGHIIGAKNVLDNLAPYLKIIKNCGSGTGCFPNVMYKALNNNDYTDYNNETNHSKAQLSDGTLIAIWSNGNCSNTRGLSPALSSVCASMVVDINGFKLPNQLGIDAFYFYITQHGIIPLGTSQDTSFPFNNQCKDKSKTGESCAAWVIYNENRDYLKCDDLSWSGKTKCN